MELSTSTSPRYTIDGSNLILNGWNYPIESQQLYSSDRTTTTVRMPNPSTSQYVLRYDAAEEPSWHNPGMRTPKTLCRLFINGKPIEGFMIKNVEFTDAVSTNQANRTFFYDLNVDLELIRDTIPDISIDKLLEESLDKRLEEIADEQ